MQPIDHWLSINRSILKYYRSFSYHDNQFSGHVICLNVLKGTLDTLSTDVQVDDGNRQFVVWPKSEVASEVGGDRVSTLAIELEGPVLGMGW